MLHVLEFDNTRKRMSVIVRHKDGSVRLYCKGADTLVLARLRDDTSDELRRSTIQHLDRFASDGLRTLCCAQKDIDAEYLADWIVSGGR